MNHSLEELARKLMGDQFEKLSEREQRVIRALAERLHVSRNPNHEFDEQMTFGQRLADQVAAFGGSWPFIILFGAFLILWIAFNALSQRSGQAPFDPYPFILLNLILSSLAALQAPIIMMSQNRQAAKDRLDASHDYEVNLKAELEILDLHRKLDALREQQWLELIALQREQIALLRQLTGQQDS